MAKTTSAPEWIGLRISQARIKESKDGGATVEATADGLANGAELLVPHVGREIVISTASKNQKLAFLRSLTVKSGKDDKRILRLKMSGGLGLEELVGVGIQCRPAQIALPYDSRAAAARNDPE